MDTNSKKSLSLLLVILASMDFCHAQHTLEKRYIHTRANDTIVKQEVAYKDPGRNGTDVFWNFGTLQPTKASYQVCFAGNDTLILSTEHQTVYTHKLNRGDSLLLQGYSNRTTRFRTLVPGVEFRYPFHYTDSLESYFYGEGKYSDKLAFISRGKEKIKADAWGTMLLPNNDTLKNVMRICVQKDICERISNSDSILFKFRRDSSVFTKDGIRNHLQNDTVVLRMKTYRWYAQGYRYPVFETVCCETFRLDSPVSYYTTAFYYPPEEHAYLEDDPLNLELQELLKEKSLSIDQPRPAPGEGDTDHSMRPDLSVYYNVYPNPVKEGFTLEYYVSDAVSVRINLFDMGGCLLEQKNPGMQTAGIHNECISMDAYPKGNYILHLVVSDKTYVEKITKE